jgi:hypothetical protein
LGGCRQRAEHQQCEQQRNEVGGLVVGNAHGGISGGKSPPMLSGRRIGAGTSQPMFWRPAEIRVLRG